MLGNLDDKSDDDVLAANILATWANWDIDIFDLNEVPFSCRNVIFACTDQNNPLLEELLEEVSNFCDDCGANVASFEYGINEAIPSSKGAPLLCPNNVISEGFVQLTLLDYNDEEEGIRNQHAFALFVGLNNGNGRGSMDVMWQNSAFADFPGDE